MERSANPGWEADTHMNFGAEKALRFAEFLAETEEPVMSQALSPSGDDSYQLRTPAQAVVIPVFLRS